MSLPRSVAEVIGKHVTLGLKSIDRLYLNDTSRSFNWIGTCSGFCASSVARALCRRAASQP